MNQVPSPIAARTTTTFVSPSRLIRADKSDPRKSGLSIHRVEQSDLFRSRNRNLYRRHNWFARPAGRRRYLPPCIWLRVADRRSSYQSFDVDGRSPRRSIDVFPGEHLVEIRRNNLTLHEKSSPCLLSLLPRSGGQGFRQFLTLGRESWPSPPPPSFRNRPTVCDNARERSRRSIPGSASRPIAMAALAAAHQVALRSTSHCH